MPVHFVDVILSEAKDLARTTSFVDVILSDAKG